MDGGVPDSDDEGYISYLSNKQNVNVGKQALKEIYSDDEDDVWPAANYHSHVEATPHPQAQATMPKKMFNFGRKATLTGATKAPRQPAGRRLVTTAVAARQQASAANAEEETHQENDLNGVDWSLGSIVKASQQSGSLQAPVVTGRPAFVGRAPPPALRPLPEAHRPSAPPTAAAVPPAANATDDTVNKPRTDTAPRIVQTGASTLPEQPAMNNGPTAPFRSTAPAAPAAFNSSFGTGMTTHRTEDGMNVIFNKRKRSGDDETAAPASKTRAAVNSGWGNNFVRIDMKVSQLHMLRIHFL